jgi:hypothetical protein
LVKAVRGGRVSDWAKEIVEWVTAVIWVYVFFSAGYALYAWFNLRDKPLAIFSGGVALTFSSDLWPVMLVGIAMCVFGAVFLLPRNYVRMTDKALKRFGPPRDPE